MDLGYISESYVHSPDLSWLRNPEWANAHAVSGTIVLANPDWVEATHYPDGVIKSGTLVAIHTSGTYDTTFGPYVADQSPDTGLTTVGGVWIDGGPIKRDQDGAISTTRLTGAILLAHWPLDVYVSKLPGLLNEAGGARPVVAGDLPATWADLDTAIG